MGKEWRRFSPERLRKLRKQVASRIMLAIRHSDSLLSPLRPPFSGSESISELVSLPRQKDFFLLILKMFL